MSQLFHYKLRDCGSTFFWQEKQVDIKQILKFIIWLKKHTFVIIYIN